MVLQHNYILDLRCVVSCDPFAIDDEHGPAPRVRGDERIIVGID